MQVMHSGLHSCKEKLELMLPVPHFTNCSGYCCCHPSLWYNCSQWWDSYHLFTHTHIDGGII